MSKYSSYKEHQLITENWRKFLNESDTPEEGEALEEIFGFGKSKEEKAQAYFDNNWPKIEDMIGDDPGAQILAFVEEMLQEYPSDANDKRIQGAVETAVRRYKSAAERDDVTQWHSDRAAKEKATSARHAAEKAAEEKAAEEKADIERHMSAQEKRRRANRNDPDAWLRTQSGPSAGSSTDRRRRRNRGELEENKNK